MITIQDLYNIVGNKISNELQKSIIRNNDKRFSSESSLRAAI